MPYIILIIISFFIFLNAMINYFYRKKKIKKEKETPEHKLKELKKQISIDLYAQWPYWWLKGNLKNWEMYYKWKWYISVTTVWYWYFIYFDGKLVIDLKWDEIENFVKQIEQAMELDDLNKKYNPQRTPTTKEVFEDLEEIEKKKKEIEDIRGKYKADLNKTFKK